MDQSDKQTLVMVVDLIKQGEKQKAVKILAELLAAQPQLEQGWYLMGVALDDPEKKRFAFKRALKINPNSERAKNQLYKLEEDALPKAPKPIRVEPPPAAPPPAEEAPVIPTPWIKPEPVKEEEVELPAWAKKISAAKQTSSQAVDEIQEIRHQTQEAEIDHSFPPFSLQDADDQPAFIQPEEHEPDAEKKEKRKRWFKKTKSEDPVPASESGKEPEPEAEKKRKRISSKEKKTREATSEPNTEERKKTLQEELLGDEPKSKFRINWRPRKGLVVFFVLFIICGLLGGGGYYYRDTLIPLITQYPPTIIALFTQEPTLTPDYTATPTATSAFPPTLPPTWTPAATERSAEIIPTLPALDITPTITPTPIPLQDSIVEEMDTIDQQIAEIRNLQIPANLDREIMPTAKFRSYMQALAISKLDREELAKQQTALRAFGFVANDYYTVEVLMNNYADFVGGYYYPEQNKVYLPGNGFYGLEKYIYSYEFGYALLQENHDIFTEFCQGTADTCLAETALITGDIALTQELWLQDYPIQFEPEGYFNLENPEPLFHEYWEPAYFKAYRNFPIRYGALFVSHLFQTDGWQTVDYTYRYPPESSEQVMHPEKYDLRENRVLLIDPDLASVLGDGWALIERETLGEWRSYLLLTAPDYPAAIRPEQEAVTAAAGWGGDSYQVYANPENQTYMLGVHWTWDTTADREEFFNSFSISQAGRFQSAEFEGPGEGICWMLDENYSCIYQNGQDILWICTNDLAALDAAKDAFAQFP